MNWKMRLCAAALAAAMTAGLAGCGGRTVSGFAAADENERFDAYLEKEFIETMESDYSTLHVFLENPEAYGVDRGKVSVDLGMRFDEESVAEMVEETRSTLEELRGIDCEQLTEDRRQTYEILLRSLEADDALNAEEFIDYGWLFESMSGLHYQLPTMFADWTLRSEQDVKDLITLVRDVQPYLASAVEYTRAQQEKGLLMIDFESVLDYCAGVLEAGEDSSVLAAMCDSIDALNLADAQKYKDELSAAFSESFLAGYQELYDALTEMQSGFNNEAGLAAFPNGREYYELLLRSESGMDWTVEEMREWLTEAYDRHVSNMQTISLKNSSAVMQYLYGSMDTGYTSYEAMLEDIRAAMTADFPEIGDLEYEIFNVNEEIASDSGVAAYFNIPALDATTPRQLRVNPNLGDIQSVDVYTTVAHEGFPGHMYQYAYLYENIGEPIRCLLNSNSYAEGYAIYAGYEAMRYLDGIDEYVLELYQENETAIYCLLVLADIGIHCDGWTLEEMNEFFLDCGFDFGSAAADQYEQLRANPCAFVPYCVGYEQILTLKEQAESELGSAFTEIGFNTMLLDSAGAHYELLEQNVRNYIADASSQDSQKAA